MEAIDVIVAIISIAAIFILAWGNIQSQTIHLRLTAGPWFDYWHIKGHIFFLSFDESVMNPELQVALQSVSGILSKEWQINLENRPTEMFEQIQSSVWPSNSTLFLSP